MRNLDAGKPAAARAAGEGSSGVNTPGSSPIDRDRDADHQMEASSTTENTSVVQKQLERLGLLDMSSDFWSRVNDKVG